MIFTDNTNLTKLVIYNMQDLQEIFDVKFWDDTIGNYEIRNMKFTFHFQNKIHYYGFSISVLP